MRSSINAFALIFALALMPGLALAAEPGEGDEMETKGKTDRPWADGVSEENQAQALEFFKEGTALLKDAFFTRAVESYKKALEHWDHPAIHFNVAKALMNLDQPVEAYKHLQSSMKYGGAPLDEEQIDQVKRYTKLLYDGELADLYVECKEPEAKVSLNGVEIFVGPGSWTGLVRADKHTIVATKQGFQTEQVQQTLDRGKKTEIMLTMTPLEQVTKYYRAMEVWKPWVVVGSGALGLIAGGIFTWQASDNFAAYDKAIEVCNSDSALAILNDLPPETGENDTGGRIRACFPSNSVKSKKSNAELFQTLSIVSYVAGGATLATGLVLLYVNREKPVLVDVPVEEEPIEEPVTFIPYFGPDGGGVSATMRF